MTRATSCVSMRACVCAGGCGFQGAGAGARAGRRAGCEQEAVIRICIPAQWTPPGFAYPDSRQAAMSRRKSGAGAFVQMIQENRNLLIAVVIVLALPVGIKIVVRVPGRRGFRRASGVGDRHAASSRRAGKGHSCCAFL